MSLASKCNFLNENIVTNFHNNIIIQCLSLEYFLFMAPLFMTLAQLKWENKQRKFTKILPKYQIIGKDGNKKHLILLLGQIPCFMETVLPN